VAVEIKKGMGKRLEAKTPFIPEGAFPLPPEVKKKFQPQSTRRPQSVFFTKD
jgi:hypothetical protein